MLTCDRETFHLLQLQPKNVHVSVWQDMSRLLCRRFGVLVTLVHSAEKSKRLARKYPPKDAEPSANDSIGGYSLAPFRLAVEWVNLSDLPVYYIKIPASQGHHERMDVIVGVDCLMF